MHRGRRSPAAAPLRPGRREGDGAGSSGAGTDLEASGTTSAAGLAGTFTEAHFPPSAFDLAALTDSRHVYDPAASTAAIAGDWVTSSSLGGDTGYLTVYADATISGHDTFLRNYRGTIAPRASGKNVFDVSVPGGCVGAMSGIAIALPQADGHPQLILMLESDTRVRGLAMSATR